MKIKDDFLLRKVAGTNIVVPLGAAELDFGGMMTLNEVGAFVWRELEKDTTEEDIVEAVLKEYAVDVETAKRDVHSYLEKMRDKGVIED